MIHDAQDGTTGRHVWRVRVRGVPSIYVIAATGQAAKAWLLRELAPELDPANVLSVTDAGGADRTEIAMWRDETRLAPNAPTDTDEQGSA